MAIPRPPTHLLTTELLSLLVMCIDGNSATLSVRYINSQLSSLWENAKECAEHLHHPVDFKASDYEKGKYTRALREFYLLTKRPAKNLTVDDLLFHAVFGKPEIKFICNHEAVLFFTIQTGHLNLAYESYTTAGFRADRYMNKPIKNLEIAFRVPFLRTNVKGRDEKIGNASAKHLIQMIALQMDEAKLIMYNPDKTLTVDVREALHFYMKKYLAFLVSSGNHVLFDLSDFDDNKIRPEIDYALIHNSDTHELIESQTHDIQLLGIDMKLVSAFYQLQWLVASSIRDKEHWGSLELCLAAICSDWVTGSQVSSHFFIDFDVPTIKPLCPCEAILSFNIKHLAFFDQGGIGQHSESRREFNGWRISFIVNVVKTEGLGLLQLDLDTARFSRHLSWFGHGRYDAFTEQCIAQMIRFFSVDYLDIISRYELHIVLNAPSKPASPEEFSEEWTGTDEEEGNLYKRQKGHAMLWTERVRGTFMFGYDQIISLSETSINSILSKRRRVASYWFKEKLTSFNVTGLSLRLLSNGKALVYVEVDGWLATKKRGQDHKYWVPHGTMLPSEFDTTEIYQFDSITVAYEVDLKMIAHTEVVAHLHPKARDCLHEIWTVDFERFHVEHLVLDLTAATYINDVSDVTALGADADSLTRLNIVKHYIPHYFAELVAHGFDILHTVPMHLNGKELTLGSNAGLDVFAFSQVAFKVVTKRNVTVKSCACEVITFGESPYIMIHGVCPGRDMPVIDIPWCPGWFPSGKSAVGTIGLSRRIILEHCILRHLRDVNAQTTVIPEQAYVVNGVWTVALTTWAEHSIRKHSTSGCQFQEVAGKQITGKENHLTFEWKYDDEWKHEHGSNSPDDPKVEYSLSCHTRNTLEVPTFFNDKTKTLDIIVRGSSVISVAGKDRGVGWSKTSSATWSASIKIQNVSGKLKVAVTCKHDSIAPASIGDQPSVESCPFDVVGMHERALQKRLYDLEDRLVDVLKTTMEGSWTYSTLGYQVMDLHDPVFTHKGDFICELDFYDPTFATQDVTDWRIIIGEAPSLPANTTFVKSQRTLNADGDANGNGYNNGYGNGYGNGHDNFSNGNGDLRAKSPLKVDAPPVVLKGYPAQLDEESEENAVDASLPHDDDEL